MRRSKYNPKLHLSIWRKEGDLYFADRERVLEQIKKVNRSNEDINRRMGYGFYHLIDLLEGKGLALDKAVHVETGIREDGEKSGGTDFMDWEKVAADAKKRAAFYEDGPF